MKRLQAYINPKMLLWGRESAGYSVDEIVKKMKLKTVTAETVQGWESGEKRPSYAQLKNLSSFYKRPVAIFYAPKPPWKEKIASEFRSLPPEYVEKMPPNMRFIIRGATVRQLDLAELHNGELPSQTFSWLEKVPAQTRNVKKIASDVRKQLKVSLSEQKKWKNAEEALKQWREKIEDLGLWVFKQPFKDDKYDGFYLPDQNFPVIYLNNNRSPQQKIVTLFHELGHFLLSKGGRCFHRDLDNELDRDFQHEEIFCKAFVGEFLVSDEELNLTHMLTDDEIKHYANLYKVSRELILRKCKDKGLLSWDKYTDKVNQWGKPQPRNKRNSGPSYYATQMSYTGNKFLKLAFSQYYQQRISESQLADYLGVKEKALPKLESIVYKE